MKDIPLYCILYSMIQAQHSRSITWVVGKKEIEEERDSIYLICSCHFICSPLPFPSSGIKMRMQHKCVSLKRIKCKYQDMPLYWMGCVRSSG